MRVFWLIFGRRKGKCEANEGPIDLQKPYWLILGSSLAGQALA